MHFFFSPIGSAGDVHPMLGVALELRQRGHAITFIVSGYFRELIERHSLRYIESSSKDQFLAGANHPDLWNPLRAFGHIYRNVVQPHFRTQYDAFAEGHRQGNAVGIINCFGFGGLIAQEKLGMPVATMHLSPAPIWSDVEPPTLPGAFGPLWLRRLGFRLGERLVIDRTVCPDVNQFRNDLDLPPVRQITRWWHSPQCVICLFPEWFAPRQPDWPKNLVHSDFPLWDERGEEELPQEVEDFLRAGEPPIIFTPGSAYMFGKPFFRAAVEACKLLKRRGVLLTRFSEQVSDSLPEGVAHFPYVSFRQLLSRAAAIVHHGGIGTTAQGFAGGIPQLIMPLAHDQFDNAARVRRLGVGDEIQASRFRGESVARKLDGLLRLETVRESCHDISHRLHDRNGVSLTANALEAFAARALP